MKFEHRETPTPSHESMINVCPQRCERQGHIVLSNVTTKLLSLRLIPLKKTPQGLGWGLKFGKFNLPRQTAFTKFGLLHRRLTKTLSHPVQSSTVRTFNIHRPQRVSRHISLNYRAPFKRQQMYWQWKRGWRDSLTNSRRLWRGQNKLSNCWMRKKRSMRGVGYFIILEQTMRP